MGFGSVAVTELMLVARTVSRIPSPRCSCTCQCVVGARGAHVKVLHDGVWSSYKSHALKPPAIRNAPTVAGSVGGCAAGCNSTRTIRRSKRPSKGLAVAIGKAPFVHAGKLPGQHFTAVGPSDFDAALHAAGETVLTFEHFSV